MTTIPNSLNLASPTTLLDWCAIGRHEAYAVNGTYEVRHRRGAYFLHDDTRSRTPIGRFPSRLAAVAFCESYAVALAARRTAA